MLTKCKLADEVLEAESYTILQDVRVYETRLINPR
jgi:hypothetical protein